MLCRTGTLTPFQQSIFGLSFDGSFTNRKFERCSRRRDLWDNARLHVALRFRVELIENESPHENWLAEDPDDDWVIQCALSGNADYIVTGNKALLGLARIGNVLIVLPTDFTTRVLESLK